MATNNKNNGWIFLSNLVGKEFKPVYGLYKKKDGYMTKIEVDGEQKFLKLNDKEKQLFEKYFKKGNVLTVVKKGKYCYVNYKKQETTKKSSGSDSKKTITQAARKVLIKNTIKEARAKLEESLRGNKYSADVINEIMELFDKAVQIKFD